MKPTLFLFSICFCLVNCTQSTKKSKVDLTVLPEEKSISFLAWNDSLPTAMFVNDTLNSFEPIKKEADVNKEYLSDINVFGKIVTMSGDKGFHTFLIISENKKEQLAVYDSLSQRKFKRDLFDYKFTKKPNHFSRFYYFNQGFVFENYTKEDGQETVMSSDSITLEAMIKAN